MFKNIYSEDCDKLAEVREELMKKYDKFSKAREEFKQAAREQMKSSIADEEDPALISKKFWSHLKAMGHVQIQSPKRDILLAPCFCHI